MQFVDSAINLPVRDASRSVAFYRSVFGTQNVDFEDNVVSLRIGSTLYFFMEHEAFLSILKPTGASPEFGTEKFTALLSATVTTRDDAYRILKNVADAGGTPCGQAVHYAWGMAAYFEDLDRHLWEIIWRQ
ncbi:MAG: hypothetical protein LDLANPLL_01917 [Turneriella sp.]|nr:hypothetical protein [Turneriella sp.]